MLNSEDLCEESGFRKGYDGNTQRLDGLYNFCGIIG